MNCFFRAIEINQKIGNTYGLALNYGRLASTYLAQSDLEKAFSIVKKSMEITENFDFPTIYTFSLLTLAEIYLDKKEYQKELEKYQHIPEILSAHDAERVKKHLAEQKPASRPAR